jgi:hypothetical protein
MKLHQKTLTLRANSAPFGYNALRVNFKKATKTVTLSPKNATLLNCSCNAPCEWNLKIGEICNLVRSANWWDLQTKIMLPFSISLFRSYSSLKIRPQNTKRPNSESESNSHQIFDFLWQLFKNLVEPLLKKKIHDVWKDLKKTQKMSLLS